MRMTRFSTTELYLLYIMMNFVWQLTARYKIGDAFFHLPLEQAQEMLGTATSRIDEETAEAEDKLGVIHEEMTQLKVELYARFGKQINLETWGNALSYDQQHLLFTPPWRLRPQLMILHKSHEFKPELRFNLAALAWRQPILLRLYEKSLIRSATSISSFPTISSDFVHNQCRR